MFCKRCGSEIVDIAMVCPRCGANLSRKFKNNAWNQPVTNYGQYSEGETPSYQQEYTAHTAHTAHTTPHETSSMYKDVREFPQQNSQIPPQSHPIKPIQYARLPVNSALNIVRISTKNNNALIVEIILSLFGLFGVGWLMAGETTIGVILLIGSIFIYWPLIILGTIFTFGLGLICLGPLVIGAIILNILLLNTVLDRQSTQYVITPQPLYTNTPPGQ